MTYARYSAAPHVIPAPIASMRTRSASCPTSCRPAVRSNDSADRGWADVIPPISLSTNYGRLVTMGSMVGIPSAGVDKRLVRRRYVRFLGSPDMADYPPWLVYDANGPISDIAQHFMLRTRSLFCPSLIGYDAV